VHASDKHLEEAGIKASGRDLREELMATAVKDAKVKDAQNSSVRVEIFDQAYNLRGSDAKYILQLAEYVDAKMRAVAQATNTIDTVRLAVLAALNIADEFHLLQRRQETGAVDYQKRAHQLADVLDELLDEQRNVG
jgi:cell division protein ZapA